MSQNLQNGVATSGTRNKKTSDSQLVGFLNICIASWVRRKCTLFLVFLLAMYPISRRLHGPVYFWRGHWFNTQYICNFDVEYSCPMCFVAIVQDALMQRKVSAGAISKAERAYIRFKTNIVRSRNFACALSMPAGTLRPIVLSGFDDDFNFDIRIGLYLMKYETKCSTL